MYKLRLCVPAKLVCNTEKYHINDMYEVYLFHFWNKSVSINVSSSRHAIIVKSDFDRDSDTALIYSTFKTIVN